MNDLICTNKVPYRIAFYSERLKGYRTTAQLSFALTLLRMQAQSFVTNSPFSAFSLNWPPSYFLLPARQSGPEHALYELLIDVIRPCGFGFAVMIDLEVVEHAPHSLTVIEVNRRTQVISTH